MEQMTEVATVGYPAIAQGFPVGATLDVNITDMGVSIGVVLASGQYWIQVKKAGHTNYMGKSGNKNFLTIMENFGGGFDTELQALLSPEWFRVFNSNPQLLGV